MACSLASTDGCYERVVLHRTRRDLRALTRAGNTLRKQTILVRVPVVLETPNGTVASAMCEGKQKRAMKGSGSRGCFAKWDCVVSGEVTLVKWVNGETQ